MISIALRIAHVDKVLIIASIKSVPSYDSSRLCGLNICALRRGTSLYRFDDVRRVPERGLGPAVQQS